MGGSVALNGGTLALGAFSQTVGQVTLASGNITGTSGILTASGYAVQSGAISAGLSGAGAALTKTGPGTVTLAGIHSYTGATDVLGGTLSVSGGSLGGTAVSVGSGLIPSATEGDAILSVTGNFTLGTSTVGSLAIRGGNAGGTPLGQGTLSLWDGGVNVLTLGNQTAGAANLTLGGTAGNAARLNLDLGQSATDRVAVGQRLVLNAGGAILSLNQLAGGLLASATYDLLTYSSGSTLGGAFSFQGGLNTILAGGGRTFTLLTAPTALQLVVATVAAPANAYWKGTLGSVWSTLNGSNQSNWIDGPTGTETQQIPGATTNVFFSADSAANAGNTTLGADFAINSLHLIGSVGGGPVQIGGGTLTLYASNANGNTSGSGISVAVGSGAHTISSTVRLGADQTWTNTSADTLTLSGGIRGGFALSLDGDFTFAGSPISSRAARLSRTARSDSRKPEARPLCPGISGFREAPCSGWAGISSPTRSP